MKPSRKLHHPKADFALRFHMITGEEHAAVLVGDMAISFDHGPRLLNLNKKHHFLTGVSVRLYKNRALDLEAAKLLGIPFQEKPVPFSK